VVLSVKKISKTRKVPVNILLYHIKTTCVLGEEKIKVDQWHDTMTTASKAQTPSLD
jgi:hypothetical protein